MITAVKTTQKFQLIDMFKKYFFSIKAYLARFPSSLRTSYTATNWNPAKQNHIIIFRWKKVLQKQVFIKANWPIFYQKLFCARAMGWANPLAPGRFAWKFI